jgi:hypothetical protein
MGAISALAAGVLENVVDSMMRITKSFYIRLAGIVPACLTVGQDLIAEENGLGEGEHGLSNSFCAGHEVMSELRQIDERRG